MSQPTASHHGASSACSRSTKKYRKKFVQPVTDGRRAALEVLLMLEQGAQVQAALDAYLRGAGLKPQDRALCTELVYGFLRAEGRIEYILHSLLRNPAKLPREMYLAMGMAVYALLFLERIPEHATVNWTVGQVRQRFGETLSKVANGALRAFVRQGDAPKQADYYLPKNTHIAAAEALLQRDSLFFSVPVWIVRLWNNAYGAAACQALLLRSAAAPHSCVRIHARSPHADELRSALTAMPSEYPTSTEVQCDRVEESLVRRKNAQGIAIGAWGVAFAPGSSPRSVANAPLSYWQQQGDISFQSAGSQMAIDALQPHTWPQPVWDMCAGQGGKSCLLYEQGVDIALCTDVHLQRLESFTGNMQRIALAFGPSVENGKGSASNGASTSCQTNSRQQSLALMAELQSHLKETIYYLSYPPTKNAKKTQLDDDEAYEISTSSCVAVCDNLHEPDCTLLVDAESTQTPDLPCCNLPLVALVDGCYAPANSWKGTILIDAPCSGLGVLSRRPDIRRARAEQSLTEILDTQARLLEAAWKCLQPGGALVYMTCTLNPAENEDQITALQKRHPEMHIVQQWQTPHEHPWLEGMFAVRCVKLS